MRTKIDWIIHCVANGACDECGTEENSFIPHACNAHTHGMARYNHLDFQIVLDYPHQEIARILNTMGLRVQSGERFKAGDFVEGIYLDCSVRLDEAKECGRAVLRVVIPDKYNIFPEDERCMERYRVQMLSTDALCIENGGTVS